MGQILVGMMLGILLSFGFMVAAESTGSQPICVATHLPNFQ
jgi:hypothetical protein